ncbi:KxYKxGKxW signal domain protein [Lentilactobacillus kisonensis F0435]|uniref:KxYKxGKxW signal domain protein n=2 Tax=Lentilactobacillus kisonensis TaxID=481722 RepID=H1LE91_9LACO|nr:KxYKxGKxW signal domain protein [Lentilactobacillus kisonensis F0435]
MVEDSIISQKQHYKMYKSGKRWLFAAITVVTFSLGGAVVDSTSVSASTEAAKTENVQSSTNQSISTGGSTGDHTAVIEPSDDNTSNSAISLDGTTAEVTTGSTTSSSSKTSTVSSSDQTSGSEGTQSDQSSVRQVLLPLVRLNRMPQVQLLSKLIHPLNPPLIKRRQRLLVRLQRLKTQHQLIQASKVVHRPAMRAVQQAVPRLNQLPISRLRLGPAQARIVVRVRLTHRLQRLNRQLRQLL